VHNELKFKITYIKVCGNRVIRVFIYYA
jgi:hypothetical protein